MSKDFEEEVFAPHGAAHFSADGSVGGMHSQDVVSKAADDGEVFRSVILAGARGVLVEYDIEYPMQLVLDAPMRAHDLGHFGGRELARERDVTDGGVFLARASDALGFDPSERPKAGQQGARRGGRRHHACPSAFNAAMGFLLGGERGNVSAGRGKGALGFGVKRPVVALRPKA